LDGFAIATHRFARMLMSLKHTVYLYGAEGSNAPCTEFIPIISERERQALMGRASINNCEYQHVIMDEGRPLWQRSNACAAAEVALRKQPGDFLLSIGGGSQKLVFNFNPDLLDVEYSIGYVGQFCKHRVFESLAWMHHCYGVQKIEDGRFFDTVIPLFFDTSEFPFCDQPDDYFLYVGRIIERKGIGIACQAATVAGIKLKIVGHGEGDFRNLITGNHEFLGPVDVQTRNALMSKARAVFVPTLYLEAFGATAVEAQLCGTPVISTPWGGMSETVEHGKTGFHCSYLGEFVEATRKVDNLDRRYIQTRASQKYSMWNLCEDYSRYFSRLQLLWKAGWNSLEQPPSERPFLSGA
jgi:glycosyltransferase involved in cell wall biosynthesis